MKNEDPYWAMISLSFVLTTVLSVMQTCQIRHVRESVKLTAELAIQNSKFSRTLEELVLQHQRRFDGLVITNYPVVAVEDVETALGAGLPVWLGPTEPHEGWKNLDEPFGPFPFELGGEGKPDGTITAASGARYKDTRTGQIYVYDAKSNRWEKVKDFIIGHDGTTWKKGPDGLWHNNSDTVKDNNP